MKRFTRLILFLALLTVSCYTGFITEERASELNQEFYNQIWRAKSNLLLPHSAADSSPIFKRGEKVKIWLELTESWIKIKAFNAGESREQARGRTVIFMIMSDLKPGLKKIGKDGGKKAQSSALERHIREEINKILEPVASRK